MERYLTLEECAEELRTTKPTVLKLLKQRLLTGIQITPGHWRILDPGPKLRTHLLESNLDRTPFLSPHEAAEVLGMTWPNFKWHMDNGKVIAIRLADGPHFKIITPKELRRFAATRERRQGPGKQIYSAAIVKWLKGYLDGEVTPNASILAEMMEKSVRIPEPRRSQVICELWALVDRANELFQEADGIKDLDSR